MLKRLYSNTKLLVQDIEFKPGLNIIYGKYSGEKEAKGINGIGKSSLVRLINFMFLGDTSEREFNKPKYDFLRSENHEIVLDFEINNIIYSVKRTFTDTNTIHFGKEYNELEEYTKQEMLQIFSNILFPEKDNETFYEGNRFRSLMQFFIKDDVQNKSRKDPTNFFSFTPNAVDKAIYNFYLMGFKTLQLINFKEVGQEYKKYRDALKTSEVKLQADTGYSIEEYRSEKLILEQKVNILEQRIKTFDFMDSHKEIEEQLNNIISKINEKSKEYHSASQRLKNVRDSYDKTAELDTSQVKKIYNEVLQNFGTALKKSLDEISEFKSEIIKNRTKFLISREKKLKQIIDIIFSDLTKLERERTKLLSQLKEYGALEKLENTYEELIYEKGLIERQNQILIQIDEYNRILNDQEIVLSEVKRDISQELLESDKKLNDLRALFSEILHSALIVDENHSSGYFDITPKRTKKTDLPFKMEVKVPKSGSLGQEDLKMISYDLMIFLNAIRNNRSLPDFLIHDGVFGNMSHKIMVNYLNYLNEKHLELIKTKNFQYIVTFSEDEIEIPEIKKGLYGEFNFDFDFKKIIELEDIPSKMLFKRNIEQ
ncbi:DUF2326 domain-containing protein [Allomuricauda taeanensis]|uniref:DUF2326 domain-containing protein n=1 Tax=Flagellimonas taeanensis TaxID=1005926 RepID=UPI002E7B4282|nr:DUF2326 domain-containing protein [Allomuricauda taeanensis]MEE1962786.1 DUF2326 domain-containing protein [Allomuricauda taeanensis]